MLDILFVTDFVCPYCLVAKEALKEALKEEGLKANITLQPLELTEEPSPPVDTFHDEKSKSRYQVLVKPCKELGLDMKLPPQVCPRPYTRLAFEGYFYALDKGKGEDFSDKVYRAYFIDEKDIGDREILSGLAAEVGLDREDFKEALIKGVYRDKEKEAVRHSKEKLKVSVVPTLYINGHPVILKSYTKGEMAKILKKHPCKNPFGF